MVKGKREVIFLIEQKSRTQKILGNVEIQLERKKTQNTVICQYFSHLTFLGAQNP